MFDRSVPSNRAVLLPAPNCRNSIRALRGRRHKARSNANLPTFPPTHPTHAGCSYRDATCEPDPCRSFLGYSAREAQDPSRDELRSHPVQTELRALTWRCHPLGHYGKGMPGAMSPVGGKRCKLPCNEPSEASVHASGRTPFPSRVSTPYDTLDCRRSGKLVGAGASSLVWTRCWNTQLQT